MKAARRTIVFLVGFSFLASLCLRRVEACYQPSPPSVKLRARTIAGTVTVNSKPSGGAVLRLHRFQGPYAIERGNADPHVLAEAVSEKNGTFNFVDVPSGRYVIFVGPPSDMTIEVELVKPKAGESDTVAIDNFADGCIGTAVFSANGRRLTNR
jgi:hypothetical protein